MLLGLLIDQGTVTYSGTSDENHARLISDAYSTSNDKSGEYCLKVGTFQSGWNFWLRRAERPSFSYNTQSYTARVCLCASMACASAQNCFWFSVKILAEQLC